MCTSTHKQENEQVAHGYVELEIIFIMTLILKKYFLLLLICFLHQSCHQISQPNASTLQRKGDGERGIMRDEVIKRYNLVGVDSTRSFTFLRRSNPVFSDRIQKRASPYNLEERWLLADGRLLVGLVDCPVEVVTRDPKFSDGQPLVDYPQLNKSPDFSATHVPVPIAFHALYVLGAPQSDD